MAWRTTEAGSAPLSAVGLARGGVLTLPWRLCPRTWKTVRGVVGWSPPENTALICTHPHTGRFPALSSLTIYDYRWPSEVAAGLVTGLAVGSRAVTHLELGRDSQPHNETRELELVDALVAAGQSHGGPFEGLTTLKLQWAGMSAASSAKLFALLLDENADNPDPLLAFPSLYNLSLTKGTLETCCVDGKEWDLAGILRGCLEGDIRRIDFSDNEIPKATLRDAVSALRECVPQLHPRVSRKNPVYLNIGQWYSRYSPHRRAADHIIGPQEWSKEDMEAFAGGWPTTGCKVLVESHY